MATSYVGVNAIARKNKAIYVGVDGIARKIKKAYVGVGGLARLCYSGGEVAFYGYAENLTSGQRLGIAATTAGNQAMFAGGYYSPSYHITVDAYDSSLVHTASASLNRSRSNLAATSINNCALFGGGGTSEVLDIVEAIDTSFTHTVLEPLSVAREYLMATTVGNYALFAGGDTDVSAKVTTVDAYDASFTHTTQESLGRKRAYDSVATTVGDYAIFAGENTAEVDVYDKSLTRLSAPPLSFAREGPAAASNGKHALFAGGVYDDVYTDTYYDKVDAYDTSLTHTMPSALNGARIGICGASAEGSFVFKGGFAKSSSYPVATADVYDASLTHSVLKDAGVSVANLEATAVGKYAIFAGGRTYNAIGVENVFVFQCA